MPSSISLQLDTFLGSWVAICYHCMQTTCPQQCLSRLEDIIAFVLFYNTMAIFILLFRAASPDFYTKSTVHVVCWWENRALGSYPAEKVYPNIFYLLGTTTITKPAAVSQSAEVPPLLLKLCWSPKKSHLHRREPSRRECGSVVLALLHGFRRWEAEAFFRASGFILECKDSLFLAPSFFALNCFLAKQERYSSLSEEHPPSWFKQSLGICDLGTGPLLG